MSTRPGTLFPYTTPFRSARGDPLVAGVDDLRQVVVGEHLFRQVAAGAGNPRINALVRGLLAHLGAALTWTLPARAGRTARRTGTGRVPQSLTPPRRWRRGGRGSVLDRKSTRLNSSH